MPRQTLFGLPPKQKLDRNQKARLIAYARAALHRQHTPAGCRKLTALQVIVYERLLFRWHSATSGVCFPSLETLAKEIGCAISACTDAIQALEAHGLLSWVHRIKRRLQGDLDAHGRPRPTRKVERTSNAYRFTEPSSMTRGAWPKTPSNAQKAHGPRNALNHPIPIEHERTENKDAEARWSAPLKLSDALLALIGASPPPRTAT